MGLLTKWTPSILTAQSLTLWRDLTPSKIAHLRTPQGPTKSSTIHQKKTMKLDFLFLLIKSKHWLLSGKVVVGTFACVLSSRFYYFFTSQACHVVSNISIYYSSENRRPCRSFFAFTMYPLAKCCWTVTNWKISTFPGYEAKLDTLAKTLRCFTGLSAKIYFPAIPLLRRVK